MSIRNSIYQALLEHVEALRDANDTEADMEVFAFFESLVKAPHRPGITPQEVSSKMEMKVCLARRAN